MSQKEKKQDRVRFAETVEERTIPKRPREEDDDDEVIPSEHSIEEAKRERRLKQKHADDDENDTHIDDRTSLATEGIQIEPFHMKNEKSDGLGYFDGDTYVFRKRADNEEEDAWLEGLDNEQETYKGKRKANDEDEGDVLDDMDEAELFARILPLVSDTETVLQAISRYGNLMKRKDGVERAKESLDQLTKAASALMLKGKVDIYQLTRNQISNLLPKDATAATKDPVEWEYQGNQDNEIHGPFTTEQMLSWTQAGYFVGEAAVKIRLIQKKSKETTDLKDDLLSDLMDDDEQEENGDDGVERGEWLMSDKVDFKNYL